VAKIVKDLYYENKVCPPLRHPCEDTVLTPKEILAFIRHEAIRAVDFRFMDFPGQWKHFTIPSERLSEATFEEGLGFDASSVRGWQAINESDMLVVPAPETAFIDPFCAEKTLTLICNIQDPLGLHPRPAQCGPKSGQLYALDWCRRHRLFWSRDRVFRL
jgi:hypothetical protein